MGAKPAVTPEQNYVPHINLFYGNQVNLQRIAGPDGRNHAASDCAELNHPELTQNLCGQIAVQFTPRGRWSLGYHENP
jgi:hypothetical protein